MIDSIEKLRILYWASIEQPIYVRDLWNLYVDSGKDASTFAEALRSLRAEEYVSDTDPLTCLPKGQQFLQKFPLRKGRDIARLFRLKAWAQDDSVERNERRSVNVAVDVSSTDHTKG